VPGRQDDLADQAESTALVASERMGRVVRLDRDRSFRRNESRRSMGLVRHADPGSSGPPGSLSAPGHRRSLAAGVAASVCMQGRGPAAFRGAMIRPRRHEQIRDWPDWLHQTELPCAGPGWNNASHPDRGECARTIETMNDPCHLERVSRLIRNGPTPLPPVRIRPMDQIGTTARTPSSHRPDPLPSITINPNPSLLRLACTRAHPHALILQSALCRSACILPGLLLDCSGRVASVLSFSTASAALLGVAGPTEFVRQKRLVGAERVGAISQGLECSSSSVARPDFSISACPVVAGSRFAAFRGVRLPGPALLPYPAIVFPGRQDDGRAAVVLRQGFAYLNVGPAYLFLVGVKRPLLLVVLRDSVIGRNSAVSQRASAERCASIAIRLARVVLVESNARRR
jgi:hypothetical protein